MSTLTAEQETARSYYLGCEVQVSAWCYDPREGLEELENELANAEPGTPEAEAAQEALDDREAEIQEWDETLVLDSENVKIFFVSGPEAIEESAMVFSAPVGAELEVVADAFLAELLSPLGLMVDEFEPMHWDSQDFGEAVLTGHVCSTVPEEAAAARRVRLGLPPRMPSGERRGDCER